MKISKNNISYFIAGFKAGLVESGTMDSLEIEKLDYETLDFGKRWRKYLNAYENKEYHDDGLKEIYKIK